MRKLPGGLGTKVVLGLVPVVLALDATAMSLGWLSGEAPAAARAANVQSAPAHALVLNANGNTVPWNEPLMVDVLGGTIQSVSVTSDGHAVPGHVDSLMWVTSHTLVPLQRYSITVLYADAQQHQHTARLTVRAQDSTRHNHVTLSPDSGTFGVGQPVVAYFTYSVPKSMRTKVEQRLSVSTTPFVAGAWHWMSGKEAHWRPPTYWKPGTQVSVRADVSGINFGEGHWGDGKHSTAFRIGDSHVSLVDVAKHSMTVRENGRVVRTMPISAGRDKYPTKSGVHIALSKSQVVTMDSATVGIPRNSPDGYYEKVYWDVRISDGGAFVHAAPWSVGSQGRRNVSHGCVNVSTANAEWFYNFSRRGDVVNIVNSGVGPDSWDPGMSDWNMSWSAWTSGD